MATAPITLTPAPATPDRAFRETFSARAVALDDWTKNVQMPELQALAQGMYTNALEVAAAATSEAFLGAWSSLTGELNMPASVSHGGKLWVLGSNLADVTAAEPGVDAAWVQLAPGAAGFTQTVQFNNGGALDASGAFLWNDFLGALILGLASVGEVSIKSADGEGLYIDGVDLTVKSGDGVAEDGEGGKVALTAGDGADAGSGGNAVMSAGGGGETGAGGQVRISGGQGGDTSGAGGSANIFGGETDVSGDGGNILLQAGAAYGSSGNGGKITISGGLGVSGDGGHVLVRGGSSSSNDPGSVQLNGRGAVLATTTTGEFVCIPNCAGAPTGVPAGILAGNSPVIYDTTNNKLWVYNGSWKSATFA